MTKCKRTAGLFVKMLILITVGAVLMMLLLIATYCIPLNLDNYNKSLEILQTEGVCPDSLERNEGSEANWTSFNPGILTTSNDYYNLLRAAGEVGKGPVYKAITMSNVEKGQYAKYWHAYVIPLRIMLLVFDIKEIRYFSFCFQILLVFALASLIENLKGRKYSFLFLLEYLLMMPLAIATSTIYFVALDITFIATFILVKRIDKKGIAIFDSDIFLLFFCSLGCLMSYTDELIICILGWAIPLIWAIIVFGEERSQNDNLKTVIHTGISWCIGYSLFWISKWIIASAYMEEDIFDIVKNSAEKWAGGSESMSRIFPIFVCYRHYCYPVFFLMIVCTILAFSIRLITCKIHKDSRVCALMLTAFGPIAWIMVLYKHTNTHHIYTYRLLSATIIAVLAVLMISAKGERGQNAGLIAKKLMGTVALICLGIAAASFIREDEDRMNANIPGHYVPFSEDFPSMTTEIHPSYGSIAGLSIGIESMSDKGEYRLRLLEDGEVKKESALSASEFIGGQFKSFDVGWRFKKGKTYKLEIAAEDTDDGDGLLVLDEGYPYVSDFSNLMNGNERVSTDIVTWIRYRKGLYGREFIFFSISVYAAIMAAALGMYNVCCAMKEKKNGN